MKAAVMYQQGALPQYVDFPEPAIQHDDELLVTVKAVAIKHFDKASASGRHYSSEAPQQQGRVIGGDGICLLEDGTRVYGVGVSGMLAEKATIHKDHIAKVPDALDDVLAAALPNAIFGAAMGLKFKAAIQPGDVVLINGATGFTGRIAVQIAKHYGAKRVIATGRNQQSLKDVLALGADDTISILQDDESFKNSIKKIHSETPIDVVIDYLWGHTAEMILACLKGNGAFTNRIRYVSVGSMAGDIIQLSAANLRSVDLQLTGSGLGAWSKSDIRTLFKEILPEMFELAANGKLTAAVTKVQLKDIAELWNLDVPDGQRLVVTI
ncbi:zinc-binding alcohol dehydrogenase family protein [Chitinophaga filiformis]|uniref:Zinc-binding alcohol dehydrogenase family protein n=1 Tax=Chitinophaga filiformis TaxID=104663 RepID=A0ABY4I6J4_CHIFI|nr:zinc-binding alcohol dehydrogenase family protein [Chitinophaga filiformis]UPK71703.1 zinc-binding alcohol dehydrogenase family protein [Chitinophaga filiformis]